MQTAKDLHACGEQPEPAALLLWPKHSTGRSLASLKNPNCKSSVSRSTRVQKRVSGSSVWNSMRCKVNVSSALNKEAFT